MQASGAPGDHRQGAVGLKVGGTERRAHLAARARSCAKLAKIISSLTFLIGYIIAAFTTRKQALHDFIATTYVVRAEPGPRGGRGRAWRARACSRR